jgi:hypothetical protein
MVVGWKMIKENRENIGHLKQSGAAALRPAKQRHKLKYQSSKVRIKTGTKRSGTKRRENKRNW